MRELAKRLVIAFVVGAMCVGLARACRSVPTDTQIAWWLIYFNAGVILGGALLVAGVVAWFLNRVERDVYDWRHADNNEGEEENDGGL